jgi:hypothetical protein
MGIGEKRSLSGRRFAPVRFLPNVARVTDPCSVKNGAEVLLEQFESQGVDCVFASPVAVMTPVWEALAPRARHALAVFPLPS